MLLLTVIDYISIDTSVKDVLTIRSDNFNRHISLEWIRSVFKNSIYLINHKLGEITIETLYCNKIRADDTYYPYYRTVCNDDAESLERAYDLMNDMSDEEFDDKYGTYDAIDKLLWESE
jgi:hypothetical protein